MIKKKNIMDGEIYVCGRRREAHNRFQSERNADSPPAAAPVISLTSACVTRTFDRSVLGVLGAAESPSGILSSL